MKTDDHPSPKVALIGICFLDAARFRENCFCAGFMSGNFELLKI